ncbi:P-loop containing nucleoside triphosphate hydrolase protein [Jaminaea rosea]|uniref:ATP-dependent DNA helicase n=1 Tax=Jaminaea rosea TaxID=1569628 RepID=A0A316V2N9_9BASI|nr:P-loop containing nucleoside triphosphate hydrolase protein [Jaminaea rosea]PWN30831.1 P-loop containing nucleoside triphosphate hydrolase protein [Jaminaea rosea]
MKLELDVQAAETFLYPTNMAKRDYQFNIVQRALFDNVLVALPTGLGKTFIAAVVILNFFRWYPKGKIVFVAPTKPLVAQQQMACHGICGLPWDVACEMTGNTAKSRRGDEWEEKRIFYMTPQTLDNDLATGDVDPKDIVCLVVDEAHRATGNYAYCNIVSQMQAVNPYFRILALTATPGSTSERVQEVIDNLHISLIELRTEEALDIRQYIHKKREEPIVVSMTDDFRHLRDLYLDVMDENCNTLVTHVLLPRCDAATLHPFRVRSIYAERKSILAQKRWLGSTINETAKMADARHHLDTFSIKMFRARIQELLDSMKKQDSKKMKLAQVINLAASMPDEAHPKMIKCVDVILDHFSRETQDSSTRVMVFCSLREAVHEIVDLLNQQEGVKATPFIGQASDKRGRGLTQKEQQEIIQKFKQGTYNVIVATSIGEEGLDIGEVDLIVCYEAVKDSVRMLQRVGRTGRKREGRIVVLMTEGPESSVWQKSKDTYKGVQQTITAGHSVTLFDDVPRLVPQSIKPTAHFEELDQPEFEPAMISSKKAAGKSQSHGERSEEEEAGRGGGSVSTGCGAERRPATHRIEAHHYLQHRQSRRDYK